MRLSTVWQRWQSAAGPWQGWASCPALTAAAQSDRAEGEMTRRAAVEMTEATRVVEELATALRAGGVMVVLDLEPVLGVYVAAGVNRRRWANAVLLVPRWPYREAILGVDEVVEALENTAGQLTRGEALPNVVFVLDADRQRGVPDRPPTDHRADNRYRLAAGDLPDLAALRQRGIQRIVKLSRA